MRRNRGWIWLGVFGLIILAPFALRSTYTKPETEGAHYFTRDSDSAHLLINGKRYLISDRDDDGHVDCFQRPGPGTMLGLTAWSVPGTLGCGKMLKREVPAELGPDFDRLLAEQYALGSGPVSPVDLDGDGQTDCAVSVFEPERSVWTSGDRAACPGKDLHTRTMTEDERDGFDRILVIEREVARRMASTL